MLFSLYTSYGLHGYIILRSLSLQFFLSRLSYPVLNCLIVRTVLVASCPVLLSFSICVRACTAYLLLSLLALLSWILCPRTFLDVLDVLCILVVPSVCFHLFSYPTVFRYSPPCTHAYMCYCTYCIVHSAFFSKVCLSTHKNLVKNFFVVARNSFMHKLFFCSH